MYHEGGTEFYDTSIVDVIPSYLSKLNLGFDVLSCEEIDELQRLQLLAESLSKTSISKHLNELTVDKIKTYHSHVAIHPLRPHSYQVDVVNRAIEYFKNNKTGKIIWACGLGKSLLSLFIVRKMNCRSILYGVPSLHLLDQLEREIKKVFPIDSVIKVNENFPSPENIDNKIIITTYHSCHKLKDLQLYFSNGLWWIVLVMAAVFITGGAYSVYVSL